MGNRILRGVSAILVAVMAILDLLYNELNIERGELIDDRSVSFAVGIVLAVLCFAAICLLAVSFLPNGRYAAPLFAFAVSFLVFQLMFLALNHGYTFGENSIVRYGAYDACQVVSLVSIVLFYTGFYRKGGILMAASIVNTVTWVLSMLSVLLNYVFRLPGVELYSLLNLTAEVYYYGRAAQVFFWVVLAVKSFAADSDDDYAPVDRYSGPNPFQNNGSPFA